ncbi:MAG TPA: CpsD/CapB family tyrosine-protein kinase [Candidatus Acidoferrum sp.]|nr:CpsD/CapB family tyrosine-protein kinase [Candidatus Acidoferrum sp.]
MSRLFNQTKKAQDWAVRGVLSEDPAVEQVLGKIEEVDAQVVDVPKSRFQNNRKIRLVSPQNKPLVSNEYVSKALPGEAYRGLRTRLMRLQAKRGIKSIVMSSTLPGEGKTLTTMNLALSFASLSDVSVLMVDADMRTCGLSHLMGDPSGPGLAEILTGEAKFEEAVVATSIPNLYAVSAGKLAGSAPELIAGAHWKEFVGWCSEAFKVILIDAPSVLPLADFDLLASACDGALVVVRAQYASRDALRKTAAQVDPNKLLGVVYNGADNRQARAHDKYFPEEPREQ